MSQNPWGEPPRPDAAASDPPAPPTASGPEFVAGAPTGASAPADATDPAQAPSGGSAPAYPPPAAGLYGPPGVYPPSATGPAGAPPTPGAPVGAYPPPGGAPTGAYPPSATVPAGSYPPVQATSSGAYPPATAGSSGAYPSAPTGQPGAYPPATAGSSGAYPSAPTGQPGVYPPAGAYPGAGGYPPAQAASSGAYGQPGSAYPPIGGAPTAVPGSGGGYEPYGQAPVYPQQYGPASPYQQPYGQGPGYQQYGYGAPAGPPRPPEIGDAVGWSWRRLWANPGAFLVMGILLLIPIGIFIFVVTVGLLRSGDYYTSGNYDYSTMGNPLSSLGQILGLGAGYATATVLFMVWMFLWQAFTLRGALKATAAQKVTFKDCFDTTNLGRYLLAVLALNVVENALTYFIPFLGLLASVVVQLATFFVPLLVLDRATPLWEAVQTSWKTVFNSQNIGWLLLLGLIFTLIAVAGGIFVIGLAITIPLVCLGQVYVYKRTLGLPVTA